MLQIRNILSIANEIEAINTFGRGLFRAVSAGARPATAAVPSGLRRKKNYPHHQDAVLIGNFEPYRSKGLAMSTALATIREEHRTISAILHGMEYLVREIRTKRKKIDPRVFHAMIYYLDSFSERMHHPKEDQYLFGILRQRNANAAQLIDQLEREHAGGAEVLRRLAQAMIRYEEGGAKEFPTFEREVSSFVEGYRNHMRKEEEELFPIALGVFTPLDWVMIDEAFRENRDPLAAARDEKDFDELFNRIVSIAPPPIGVGPAAQQP